ncbi:MAG: electron transfer flavoprotein subunit alpha/FixB family protein [Lachnospiraceae bacterium]
MKKALIFTERENFTEAQGILEVLHRMYPQEQVVIYVVFLNTTGESARGYADIIIQLNAVWIEPFDAGALSRCLEKLQRREMFDTIIIPATGAGRMLAPRLAMRLGVGLVADVTDIRYTDGQVEMIRPAFDGKVLAGIIARGDGPIMMSVRPGAFSYQGACDRDTKMEEWRPDGIRQSGMKVLSSAEKPVRQDIKDSRVLVSGGGGVKEHFTELTALANALHGMVAASRMIVDSGLANRSIQVGQSGKTVSPRLYIALGIYGSMQHFEGLRDVGYIISVNTNKLAPLCSVSDIVVEGEAYEFVKKLINRIEQDTSKER